MKQRIIKFKGKRKGGTEWLIGDLNHMDGKSYIFDRSENAPLNSTDWFEVDPETICQFIGHTDKLNKEIFENDVYREEITINNSVLDVVCYFVCKWFEQTSSFVWMHYDDLDIDWDDEEEIQGLEYPISIHKDETKKIQIIGNVIDEPRFLTADPDEAFLEDEAHAAFYRNQQ